MSSTGVSNTRPAGRMWPARYICAASEHPKKWQNYKYWSNLAYFEVFSWKLRPAKAFFLLNCGMWPSDEFEFGTPEVNFTNVLRAAFIYVCLACSFLCLSFRFVFYWHKTVGAKAACRTLMKLNPGLLRFLLVFCNWEIFDLFWSKI